MRFSVLTLLAVFGWAALAGPANAADDCANASDQATMNACADKAYKASDASLNKLYKQIRQRLKADPDATRLLVAAQKTWVVFRDAECSFSSSAVSGGSIYPMMVTQCRDGLTQTRISDFKTYLNCEEGDMSCPVPPSD